MLPPLPIRGREASIPFPRWCSSHGHDCRVPVAICDDPCYSPGGTALACERAGVPVPRGDRAGRRPPGRGAGRDQPESPATPHGREPAGAGRGEAGEPGRGAAAGCRPQRRPRPADSRQGTAGEAERRKSALCGALHRAHLGQCAIGGVSRKAADELMVKASRRFDVAGGGHQDRSGLGAGRGTRACHRRGRRLPGPGRARRGRTPGGEDLSRPAKRRPWLGPPSGSSRRRRRTRHRRSDEHLPRSRSARRADRRTPGRGRNRQRGHHRHDAADGARQRRGWLLR